MCTGNNIAFDNSPFEYKDVIRGKIECNLLKLNIMFIYSLSYYYYM